MGLGIYKLISFLSLEASTKIFKQRIPFSYLIFNFFYKKLIVNKKLKDPEISKFHKSGYVKLNINLRDEVERFKNKFFIKEDEVKKLGPKKNERVKFGLNEKDHNEFCDSIKTKLSPVLKKLEKYFNCDVLIARITPFRIQHIEDGNDLTKEYYANHFHQDSYLMLYHKLFINLMDVNEDDGPLQLVPIENRNSFFKSFKYKNRNNYDPYGDQNLLYKNSGKKGECFLFSSPQVMHRAGIPKNYRDIVNIELISIPKRYSDKLNLNDSKDLVNFAKPQGLINTLKIFLYLFKEKLILKRVY